MAFSKVIRVRFNSFLPGAGYDASGNPKQGKTSVRGQVAIVDYTRGGVALTATELGLVTLDDIDLKLIEPVRSSDPIVNKRFASYSHGSAEFYVYEWRQDHIQFYLTGGERVDVQGVREVAEGTDFTLAFDGFGDSVRDNELT